MIENPKGDPNGRQTELVPRRLPENSNEDLSRRKKEVIPRHQQKKIGIPEKESPGIFTPKYDPDRHQKEINSKVPEGKFLRRVQFLRRAELEKKGNHSEALAGEFCASGIRST